MSTPSTTTTTTNDYTPKTTITDPIFLQGLSSILAPYYERQASIQEIQQVTQRAETFYLLNSSSNSTPTTTRTTKQPEPTSVPTSSDLTSTSSSSVISTSTSTAEEPPYPISFQHLAQLIQSGQPIPGIKEIPDLLNQKLPSQSIETIKKKPWEKVNFQAEEEEHDKVRE
ncbi:hypothetical protein JCM3765_003076 [Sporobolomyces pararoseus]